MTKTFFHLPVYDAAPSALSPSIKICRFLRERIVDSEDAGIPCKIERVCQHPFFREKLIDITQGYHERAREALEEADRLLAGSPTLYSRDSVSVKVHEAYEFMVHATQVLDRSRRDYPITDLDKPGYFTNSNKAAARQDLEDQLGSWGAGNHGSQLVDWLIGEDRPKCCICGEQECEHVNPKGETP